MAEEAETAERELSSERVAELRDAGEAELIDVRTDHEWGAGHLAGARHLEVNELTAQAESIPKDRPVVFVCRGGGRSGMAAQAFREAGWDAYSMAGGMAAWAEAGRTLEPAGGEVADPLPPSA